MTDPDILAKVEAISSLLGKARARMESVRGCSLIDAANDGLRELESAIAQALQDERDRQTARVAELEAALKEIADESPMPDAFEFYDHWNDPAPYLVRHNGELVESGMKSDDYQDWGYHGYARGVHSMSLKARAALQSTASMDKP
jgi:predicted nuclease with TOPRIM domain